jgi:hypothetical protein
MSNRKKIRPADRPHGGVGQWFAAHDGLRVPGGCLDCDAEQELVTAADGVYRIKIAHDSWRPTYRRMRATTR